MDTHGYLLHSKFVQLQDCIPLGREMIGLLNSTRYVFLLLVTKPNMLRKISGYLQRLLTLIKHENMSSHKESQHEHIILLLGRTQETVTNLELDHCFLVEWLCSEAGFSSLPSPCGPSNSVHGGLIQNRFS